ncbi:MAG: DNA (cytosine-5-)-methyltransferase [Bacteroidales bacterium]|nr:DNA (cytosine-5-)-methyltransferase [Bacteroidales bacterium]
MKSETRLNMLSLFSGCGGMDLGFEGAFICNKRSVPSDSGWIGRDVGSDWVLLEKNRFSTVFANDILEEAYLTWNQYMSRFGKEQSIYHLESIVALVKRQRSGENVFPENVDVVTGGFPCQDFSVAGKRLGFNSITSHDGTKLPEEAPSEENRGKLYFWMKQVIDIVKPKVFIAENVKGLTNLGDIKNIIQRDFSQADGDGYIVLPPRVLHAGDYGVPETRERVIFIGIRRSALKPEVREALESDSIPRQFDPYPPQTHKYTKGSQGVLSPVSCREVFEGLKEPKDSEDLSQMFYSKAKYMGKHCQGQSEIHLDGLGPTIRSEHHGNIEYRRLSREHGGKLTAELDSGLRERRLTPRECALIQTFPPDYPFVSYKEGTKRFKVSQSGAYKVIGNAVPPVLAYNIARRLQDLWPVYFG